MKTIILNIKKNFRLMLSVLVLGSVIGYFIGSGGDSGSHEDGVASSGESVVTTWTCSMHPQIKQNKQGLCPLCAMDLTPLEDNSSEGEGVDPNEIKMSPSAAKLAAIQTTLVKRGVPVRDVSLLGKIKPDERRIAQLTARYGGRIEKLMVNYRGQKVKKGDVLGTIYSPQLVVAQKELLEAYKFKASNPSFYKAAYGKLKLWDLTAIQIDAIVEKGEPQLFFKVLAPISGTVTKRHVAIGDYIKEGAALFEVVDLTKLWVMFDAYETDLVWINVGDEANFNVQSIPGKTFKGKVTYIDPFIDAKSRVAKVRIEISNRDGRLKPEMFVNGRLHSKGRVKSNKLMIPKSAILWTGKRAVVYVKVPDRESPTFIYREIILGAEAGNFYVVAKGLLEEEEIAINGVFKIDASAQLAGLTSMMNPSDEKVVHIDEAELVLAKFKVAGNCGMCKETIEKAAKALQGVNSARWNSDTKEMKVRYNKSKTSIHDIHMSIADKGYDTDKHAAKDNVYDNLHSCCRYTRGEVKIK